MVQQAVDMNGGVDTDSRKRHKQQTTPASTSPTSCETHESNVQRTAKRREDPMDIDFPNSSPPYHLLSGINIKYPQQEALVPSIPGEHHTSNASLSHKGLGSFAMFSLLPRIMAYLSSGDLGRLALVNKDFHHEAMRLLYKHLSWDLQDHICNATIVRLITSNIIQPAVLYVRSLFLQVRSPPVAFEHETSFRLGLLPSVLPKLKFLKKLSIADCRDAWELKKYGTIDRMTNFVEEIIWGEGTKRLETFEVLMERDLNFFTSLLPEGNPSLQGTRLGAPPHSHGRRKPSIKHFTLRGTYPKGGDVHKYTVSIFEYQLAYLLLALSPSLTHLTLVGLPKPSHVASPQAIGTGEWGGSVGKVFEILGPRALQYLEELTIEAADTRYEVAETVLSSWITDRSIHVKPPTDEQLRQKQLKKQEKEISQPAPTSDNSQPSPLSDELRWHIFSRFHFEDYDEDGESHLNCGTTCHIHGSTSGTFALAKSSIEQTLHVNPLLRLQPPKRRFHHLHLINCPEPWPAFFTIACLHPPTTMHFSSPWMDASSSDIPNSIRELGIEKRWLAAAPKLRKIYGKPPGFPVFSITAFTPGADHPDGDQDLLRPTSNNRLHCRRIRKNLAQYMTMLGQAPDASCPMLSSPLAQVMASNIRRIELRTLERVSMKLMENIVDWYGEGLEVIGISRLDGLHKEESAGGHVRGWGKILGRCSKLKELRVVWNLFDDDVDWEKEKQSGTKMKFGIGERSFGGKEALIGFSQEEWWESVGVTSEMGDSAAENDDSSSDGDNGEGPSTQRTMINTTHETPSPTISADKSSESNDGSARPRQTNKTQDTGFMPFIWLENWFKWSAMTKFFAPTTSGTSYVTPEGARYLMKSKGPQNDASPTAWTKEQKKELLVFLIDWKYSKMQEVSFQHTRSVSTGEPRPPAKRSLSPPGRERECVRNGRTLLQPQHGNLRCNDFFHEACQRRTRSDKVFHGSFISPSHSLNCTERHNASVFMDRLMGEYMSRKNLLASAIWDIIDTDIGQGKTINRQGWRNQFLVLPSVQGVGDGIKPPQGIIFTNAEYNEFDGDVNTETYFCAPKLGEWETALTELLRQTPPVFNVSANDKLRTLLHLFVIRHLSSFFQEINLWHRKLRIESTLGKGVKQFCGMAWVMFEEAPTLETVVGLMETGREITARPVRSYQGSKIVVEMVKIRCWSCGGGWAGDYSNGVKGSGNTPLRVRVGARECKCDITPIHRSPTT